MLSRNSGEKRALRRSVIIAQPEAIPASLRWPALFVFILFFLPVLPIAAQTHALTYHNDNARTGQNVTEVILTPGNVNSTNFGKLGFLSVNGLVDAEPLYVSNLTVAGNQHNLVFVVTEHDSVFAFDADTFAQLWKVTVLGSGETTSDNRGCDQVSPEIGITSTPVIDLNVGPHGTLFVVAMSKDNFGNCSRRVFRGGCWGDFPALHCSALRPGIGLRPRYGVRNWSAGAAVWDSVLPECLIDVETG